MAAKAEANKQQKREARELRDQARAAFEAGNYCQARELDQKIIDLVPDHELGREAKLEREGLTLDPMGLYVGVFSIVLFAAASAFALW